MTIDQDIILRKIGEIEVIASKSSVTRKGETAQKKFIDSSHYLSKQIEKSSPDGLCLLISEALSEYLTALKVLLEDINIKHDRDYEDFMDSLPEGDDE